MKKIFWRGLTLIATVFIVLMILIVTFGVTGFSDKMLGSVVNQELREMRTSLSQTIRDPEELERVLKIKEEELREFHGLNDAWYDRIPDTMKRVVTLDLGEAKTIRSFDGSSEISDIVWERLPNTMVLMTTSFLIVAAIGTAVGAWLATNAGGKLDRLLSIFAATSFAMPAWWLGVLAIALLSYNIELLPSGGMYSTPPPIATFPRIVDMAKHAILPVGTLVLVSVGPYLYSIRTVTLSVAREDFVAFARARGLTEARIRWRYILRVASPTVVTDFVFGLVGSISGAIITETVFNWPGMGRLYYDAMVGTPDEGLIIALTFMFTLIYVIARFILEILYVWLDPRIRT